MFLCIEYTFIICVLCFMLNFEEKTKGKLILIVFDKIADIIVYALYDKHWGNSVCILQIIEGFHTW